MKELIFSIENIFKSDNQDDCLVQYGCTCYHIPAYQRGYKWGTEKDGAVSILLSDLWNNFLAVRKGEKKEYYLQYITVKKTSVYVGDNQVECLEVIDGQQRLTTLSIIISVLSALSNNENISVDKLHYAIRENFFSEHIYQKNDLLSLTEKEWSNLQNTALDTQDIFYLFSAAKKSFSFFIDKEKDIDFFYKYLLSNVKLIVNSVEPHVQSETVFKNLNSNKIPLTEVELIKGLMITKVGRGDSLKAERNYKEVLAERAALGRKWDEITRWANQAWIKSFYFNQREGMYELLSLTSFMLDNTIANIVVKTSTKDLPLFNFFNQYTNNKKAFTELQNIYETLKDWYADDEKYNLIGFCRFVKESKNNNLPFLKKCLEFKTKAKLLDFLLQSKQSLLPKSDVTKLRYNENEDEMHAVLLALSVFSETLETRFNFHEFIDKKWSLEHIFPQSPEGKDKTLNEIQKQTVIKMIGESITPEIKLILAKPERTEEEKKQYYTALQNLSELNSIGNMCLLTNSDNSSNGCGFFDEKRKNILHLIHKGSFVPSHTFDVFSKMISTLVGVDLSVWSADDIKNHTEYINNTLILKPISA